MAENGNGKNGNYTAAQFIEAIPGSAGIISTIARRVGCEWHTAKRYIDSYATVKQAYEDEREAMLDMSESVVYGAIQREYSKLRNPDFDGDVNTGDARWYLATKGKDRGFTERHEQQQIGDITVRVIGGFIPPDADSA